MDISDLKRYSDLSYDRTSAKKNALEKVRGRQLISYNNHLFLANADTINLVSNLKNNSSEFYILDTNNNPCQITNPQEFLDLLISRNQESLLEYHQLYEKLKKRI